MQSGHPAEGAGASGLPDRAGRPGTPEIHSNRAADRPRSILLLIFVPWDGDRVSLDEEV